MLHNDTPKFTIPTTRSFSKSLALSLSLFSRLHFEREQDQSKRIVNSRTLSRRPIDENRRRHGFCEPRKIGDASVMVFFSLSFCTQGRWTRISEADDSAATHASSATNTGTTRCARECAISRARGSPCHVHTRAILCTREFFSSFFLSSVGLRNRLVSSDEISNTSNESNSLKQGKIRRIFYNDFREVVIYKFTCLYFS